MSEPHPTACPECKSEEHFRRVYGCPVGLVYGDPTTVGQQAELNAKRLGKEQLQKMYEEDCRRRGVPTREEQKANRPWWRTSDKPLDLSKIKDPAEYIRSGKKG